MSPISSPLELPPEATNSAGDSIMPALTSSHEENAIYQQGKGEDDADSSCLPEVQKSAADSESNSTTFTSTIIEAPSTTGVDLKEFQLFPKLPIELRLQIWRATFPRSRVILLGCPPDRHGVKKWYIESIAALTNPRALQVNSESREEALKTYEPTHYREVGDKGTIYVNYENDIFWIRYFYLPLQKIQRLLIRYSGFGASFSEQARKHKHTGSCVNQASIKELLITASTLNFRSDRRNRQIFPTRLAGDTRLEFVEDMEEENKDDAEEEEIQTWKAKWMTTKRDVLKNFEAAKQDHPDWKAPILKFGHHVVFTDT